MKTLLVTTDDDMSSFKERALVVGVADCKEKANSMLLRNDIDLVVLDREMLNVLSKLASVSAELPCVKEKTFEEQVRDLLLILSLPPSLMGYKYLEETILIILRQPENERLRFFKAINIDVAKKCNSTASSVERGMRHLIESRWRNIPVKLRVEIFGSRGEEPLNPTVSEFIYSLVEYLRRKYRSKWT